MTGTITAMSAGERPDFAAPAATFGMDVTGEIARLTERMDMYSVGDFACHAQHPRIHRGNVDVRIGCGDRSRAPLGSDEVEIVELAVVIERPGPERGETRLHGEHVVAQPRTGMLEGHAVAPHDMRAHLRAQTEPELSAGRLLQFPRRRRRDEWTARKRNRDAGRQFKPGAACDATAALR